MHLTAATKCHEWTTIAGDPWDSLCAICGAKAARDRAGKIWLYDNFDATFRAPKTVIQSGEMK